MKVVIMGCGRIGARLAQLMEEDRHQVSILDSDISSFRRLPPDFKGHTTLGTGIDVDVLRSAGIEGADAFVAVTNSDNTNIMACQVAKEIFGVKKVLARIYDPGRESLYHQLGLETVCPTTLISITARDILLAPEGVEILQFPPHNMQGNGLGAPSGETRPLSQRDELGRLNKPVSTDAESPTPQEPVQRDERKEQEGRGLRGFFRH